MSRWFRWYDGTTEDGKLRAVARMSRVTVRDVIALWAFLLEDASHVDHRGVCVRNEDFMAAVLDFESGVVEEILAAMESVRMISVGIGAITLCNWDKRQFESDTDSTAAERQRRKRERDKAVSNDDVTDASRVTNAPQIQIQKQNTEGEVSPPPEPKLHFGEFGNVRLTAAEHGKLSAKLTGLLNGYIDRLDRYAGVNPKKFKQYVDHYKVILTWHSNDVRDGKAPDINPPTGPRPFKAVM